MGRWRGPVHEYCRRLHRPPKIPYVGFFPVRFQGRLVRQGVAAAFLDLHIRHGCTCDAVEDAQSVKTTDAAEALEAQLSATMIANRRSGSRCARFDQRGPWLLRAAPSAAGYSAAMPSMSALSYLIADAVPSAFGTAEIARTLVDQALVTAHLEHQLHARAVGRRQKCARPSRHAEQTGRATALHL